MARQHPASRPAYGKPGFSRTTSPVAVHDKSGRYHGGVTRLTAEVVFFDLDDTLFDHHTAARAAIADWGRSRGWAGDPTRTAERWDEYEILYFTQYERGEISLTAQRTARIRAFLDQPDLAPADAMALWEEFRGCYEAHWVAFPDAIAAVTRCRDAGVRVGIVTNGSTAQQFGKVHTLHLPVDDDAVFISEAVGVAKPDPAIFRVACTAMCVTPDDALMVGDNPVNDIDCARTAGLRTVRLDRSGTTPGALTSLDDLVVTRL